MRQRRRQQGYSLIEALVALAVLAIGVAALAAAIGGGYRGFARALDETGALQVAQSRLETAGATFALEDGARASGDDGGYLWTLSAERYRPEGGTPPLDGLDAFTVAAEVAWRPLARGAERRLRLVTIRLKGGRRP